HIARKFLAARSRMIDSLGSGAGRNQVVHPLPQCRVLHAKFAKKLGKPSRADAADFVDIGSVAGVWLNRRHSSGKHALKAPSVFLAVFRVETPAWSPD
ncbi:MAG: hypothetical protein ACREED_05245, partial [Stellaceae bacterium]